MSATAPKDAGEAYRIHGANGFRNHVRNNQRPFEPQTAVVTPNKRVLPPIVDIMDFLNTSLPKAPELIGGVLEKGSKLILSGGSKSRKTWALTHLAMCVAAGESWWGFPTVRGKVLYANFELRARNYQDRVNAIKDKLVLQGSKLAGQLELWNLRGFAADISELADEVIERVGTKYDLIILDPIYKVLGERDENSNSDIAGMMNELDRIVEATGAAIAFAHHFSKGNQSKKSAMDRMSGAGAFARDADSMLVMTEHTEPDTYTIESVLRNHKPIEAFCVSVDHPIMERNTALDPKKMKAVNGAKQTFVVADLMKLLGIQQVIRAELKRQFVANVGGDGTFNKLYKDAQDGALIELCEDGKRIKAVNPIYPPAYNACRQKEEEKSAVVQQ